MRNIEQDQHAEGSDTALDPAHIGAIEPDPIGEPLLAESSGPTQFADTGADLFETTILCGLLGRTRHRAASWPRCRRSTNGLSATKWYPSPMHPIDEFLSEAMGTIIGIIFGIVMFLVAIALMILIHS